MIELVSPSRCTGCNICVATCPTAVFDAVPGGAPAIARQVDCQTCFLCELYCPEDALYVAPDADLHPVVAESLLAERRLLGSYRRAVGWQPGAASTAADDRSYELLGRVR